MSCFHLVELFFIAFMNNLPFTSEGLYQDYEINSKMLNPSNSALKIPTWKLTIPT